MSVYKPSYLDPIRARWRTVPLQDRPRQAERPLDALSVCWSARPGGRASRINFRTPSLALDPMAALREEQRVGPKRHRVARWTGTSEAASATIVNKIARLV
jgi:hypothetical protein